MLDLDQAKTSQHNYYANLPTEGYNVNCIREFAFTDTDTVPELFRNFAVEYFGLERWRRVDLDKLNATLNELWSGPGSAARISDITWDLRIARREGLESSDALKGYETPTIDSDLAPVPDLESQNHGPV